jgi:hypothetical protein
MRYTLAPAPLVLCLCFFFTGELGGESTARGGFCPCPLSFSSCRCSSPPPPSAAAPFPSPRTGEILSLSCMAPLLSGPVSPLLSAACPASGDGGVMVGPSGVGAFGVSAAEVRALLRKATALRSPSNPRRRLMSARSPPQRDLSSTHCNNAAVVSRYCPLWVQPFDFECHELDEQLCLVLDGPSRISLDLKPRRLAGFDLLRPDFLRKLPTFFGCTFLAKHSCCIIKPRRCLRHLWRADSSHLSSHSIIISNCPRTRTALRHLRLLGLDCPLRRVALLLFSIALLRPVNFQARNHTCAWVLIFFSRSSRLRSWTAMPTFVSATCEARCLTGTTRPRRLCFQRAELVLLPSTMSAPAATFFSPLRKAPTAASISALATQYG